MMKLSWEQVADCDKQSCEKHDGAETPESKQTSSKKSEILSESTPGSDMITAEKIKASGEQGVEIMHEVYNSIWNNGWKTGPPQ